MNTQSDTPRTDAVIFDIEENHPDEFQRMAKFAQQLERELNAIQMERKVCQRLADIGMKWEKDSSIENWFPFEAERIERLERELNAAKQISEKYEDRYFQAQQLLNAANERIKRMEEAANKMQAAIANGEGMDEACREWIKAKETTP
jgi:hypothetical protein